jgi:DNA polymerase-1
LLLVLDGNSLLHRAYHAAAMGRLLDEGGRPVWALKGLIGYLARAAARLRPDAVLVGFRLPRALGPQGGLPGVQGASGGQAGRPDRADPGRARPAARGRGGDRGAASYEADDVLASAAAHARRAGWRTVVVTSDRDAYALLDASTSVLRVRNGGLDAAVLITPDSLATICGVQPWQYRDYAALRGDPSDNLAGVRGFGSATAARLLTAFGTIDAAWAALDRGEEHSVHAVVGEALSQQLAAQDARAAVDRNRRLMRMRIDLPMPDLDTTRLPLNLLVMRRALAARGIILGPSLWALTGGTPPPTDEELALVPQPWVWRRSLRRPPRSRARSARAVLNGRPDQLEALEHHRQVVAELDAQLFALAAEVSFVRGPPPGQGAIALALVPGERGVDLVERLDPHLGRADHAHRLAPAVEHDRAFARLRHRCPVAFVLQQQAGGGALGTVADQVGELVGHGRRVAERERSSQWVRRTSGLRVCVPHPLYGVSLRGHRGHLPLWSGRLIQRMVRSHRR